MHPASSEWGGLLDATATGILLSLRRWSCCEEDGVQSTTLISSLEDRVVCSCHCTETYFNSNSKEMTQIYNKIRSPAIILVSTLAMGASNYSLNKLASFPRNLIPAKSETKKAYKAVISKNPWLISSIYTYRIRAHNHSCFCSLIHRQDRGIILHYMGVSKNRCTPKWMVKIMEKTLFFNGMIWGERYHYFWKTSIYVFPLMKMGDFHPTLIARGHGRSERGWGSSGLIWGESQGNPNMPNCLEEGGGRGSEKALGWSLKFFCLFVWNNDVHIFYFMVQNGWVRKLKLPKRYCLVWEKAGSLRGNFANFAQRTLCFFGMNIWDEQ